MSSVKVENIIIENDQISKCLVILDNKQKYEVEYKANEYFVTQQTSSSSPQLTLETTTSSKHEQNLEKTIETIVKQLKDSKSK